MISRKKTSLIACVALNKGNPKLSGLIIVND